MVVGAWRDDVMAGDELCGFPTLLVPATYGFRLGVGFALELAVEEQHGIRPDHHVMGILGGDHGCFCARQREYNILGVGARRGEGSDDSVFIHVGGVKHRCYPGRF